MIIFPAVLVVFLKNYSGWGEGIALRHVLPYKNEGLPKLLWRYLIFANIRGKNSLGGNETENRVINQLFQRVGSGFFL